MKPADRLPERAGFNRMKPINETTQYRGNWLVFKERTYRNRDNREIRWETIERTRPVLITVIVPRLVPSGRIVLIRQFRPTINRAIIGFPAGMVPCDQGIDESFFEQESLRELKEETGYTGTIVQKSPLLKVSSGIMDQGSRLVHAIIDERLPENMNPVQQLEPSEQIEVLAMPEAEIRSFLFEEIEKGNHIGAGVWYLFGVNLL